MLTIACVLRSGPEYRVEHVAALAAGVRRHLTLPHLFACLTDLPRKVDSADDFRITALPLKHDWPGWWSKIELFRPGLFDGPVVYFDLDTVIVGPLDDLVLGHRFTVLENFWSDQRIGSGLMAWHTNEDLSRIYKRFCMVAAKAMREYVTTDSWGDQGWIKAHTPIRPALWQKLHPGRVISYKKHVLPAGGVVPVNASIIAYHGKPRPWQTPLWKPAVKRAIPMMEPANVGKQCD